MKLAAIAWIQKVPPACNGRIPKSHLCAVAIRLAPETKTERQKADDYPGALRCRLNGKRKSMEKARGKIPPWRIPEFAKCTEDDPHRAGSLNLPFRHPSP